MVYLSLRKPPELGVGGVQDGQVLEPGEHLDAVAVIGDLRDAGLLALADEGVGDLVGADEAGTALGGLDPLPGVLLDADAGPVDRLGVVHEVAGELDAEVLGALDPVLLGEGVDRVLGGVGRQDVGVGTAAVDLLHVAGQGDGDVQVLDVVRVAVTRDLDNAVLRLAVLVLSQDETGHGVGQLPR